MSNSFLPPSFPPYKPSPTQGQPLPQGNFFPLGLHPSNTGGHHQDPNTLQNAAPNPRYQRHCSSHQQDQHASPTPEYQHHPSYQYGSGYNYEHAPSGAGQQTSQVYIQPLNINTILPENSPSRLRPLVVNGFPPRSLLSNLPPGLLTSEENGCPHGQLGNSLLQQSQGPPNTAAALAVGSHQVQSPITLTGSNPPNVIPSPPKTTQKKARQKKTRQKKTRQFLDSTPHQRQQEVSNIAESQVEPSTTSNVATNVEAEPSSMSNVATTVQAEPPATQSECINRFLASCNLAPASSRVSAATMAEFWAKPMDELQKIAQIKSKRVMTKDDETFLLQLREIHQREMVLAAIQRQVSMGMVEEIMYVDCLTLLIFSTISLNLYQ
jgi:hypothetical protein